MKIVVLGSGLLGVSTAYELAKRGFEVTVIDRQGESGRETSFANGAQLSYSAADPWANPALLTKLPGWLFRSDAPLVFRLRADPHMINWILAFLRNCTPARTRNNHVNLLRLALYSKSQFEKIRKDTGIEFDFAGKGILHVYGTEKEFDQAKKQRDFQAKFGCVQNELTPEECLKLEPALEHSPAPLVGGIHSVMDETGDAYIYCRELAKYCAEKLGVTFQYGVTLKKLIAENGRIMAASTDQGDIAADGFVMALGSYSTLQMRKLGVTLPIYPMKGYSVTIKANEYCPSISLSDGTHKIVYSRVGENLRVAGTAEFAGYNDKINQNRITPIIDASRNFLPMADWDDQVHAWACLRPQTPDGPPIIGPTPYHNLFLNTGHGTLGWTQAAGSASLLADIMEGKPPAIIMLGLTLRR